MPGPVEILTYQDLIDHGVDYLRGNPSADARRDVRRAVLSAVRIFSNEHQWSYYTRPGRILTDAPQDTGSVQYDHSEHTSGERILTLAGASWPAWARTGRLRIGNIIYQVASRLDSTNLQLAIDMNPGSDLDAGTDYTLYRNSYPMPADLVSIDEMFLPEGTFIARYIHPREWHRLSRYIDTASSTWLFYTIMGSRDFQNTIEAAFYPYPDSQFPVDFMYRRRMEPLQVEEESGGTVSTSIGDTTLTGDGTNFSSVHVGSIMRLAQNDVAMPTGRTGASPYFTERTVMTVTNSAELEVDQEFNDGLSDVKYTISDPLDIEPGVMSTAFMRCMEREICIIRRMFGDNGQEMRVIQELYQEALGDAKDADSRVSQMRNVYVEGFNYSPWPRRLIYFPSGADVT